jgi:hypothetical protein
MGISTFMIEGNGSDCNYMGIFTHRVGSIGASRRRKVFIRRTNTEQREVFKFAARNTKANIFQKGSVGFKAPIDLSKKSASRRCLRLRKESRLNFSKATV